MKPGPEMEEEQRKRRPFAALRTSEPPHSKKGRAETRATKEGRRGGPPQKAAPTRESGAPSLRSGQGRGGDAQKDQDGAIEPQDVSVGKTPDQRSDFAPGNRSDLVHHQARSDAEAVRSARLDEEPEEGRIGGIGGEGANGDGSGLVEAVILKDHRGTRLSRVVLPAGNGPNLAAPHAPFPWEEESSEMASMKS